MRQIYDRFINWLYVRFITSDTKSYEQRVTAATKRIDARYNSVVRPFIWEDAFMIGQFVVLGGFAAFLLATTNVPEVWPLWLVLFGSIGLILFWIVSVYQIYGRIFKQRDEQLQKLIDEL